MICQRHSADDDRCCDEDTDIWEIVLRSLLQLSTLPHYNCPPGNKAPSWRITGHTTLGAHGMALNAAREQSHVRGSGALKKVQ